MTQQTPRAASAELARLDQVFGRVIRELGPLRLTRAPRVDERFELLARAIAYQQLAGKAAASIWGRVQALVPGPFEAEAVLELPESSLRGAGLSGAKTAAVIDLAQHVADGRLDLVHLGRKDDEAVIEALVQVRGIGRWTGQMFLMSALRRLDVWPVGDLGVRMGYAYAHDLDEIPEPKELDELGERLRPYRSVAAWYCWRAVHAHRSALGAR